MAVPTRSWRTENPAPAALVVPAAFIADQPVRTAGITPVEFARSVVRSEVGAVAPLDVASVAAVAGSAVGEGLLRWLGGGDGGGSVVGPLAWTAVAASRRQLGDSARTTVPASAVVSTGQPASATAAGQPFVRSIVLPPRWTYGTGKTLTFTLKFSEPVQVQVPEGGSLTLPVQVGFAMRDAEYVRGTGTNCLVFKMKVTADDVGAISIGRVSTALQPGATAPARIFDFNGTGSEQAPVAHPKIVDSQGNPASETMPAVNTGKMQVDARGPGVVSFGDNGAITMTKHLAVLKVTFDQPVVVKGHPTVPVTVGGVNQRLVLVGGSGTSTLTFAMLRRGSEPGAVSFGTDGQVIDLPPGADIKDRLGNSIDVILGAFGKQPGTLGPPLTDSNGDTMVVLGSHYEKLGPVAADQLNEIMTTGLEAFYGNGSPPYTDGYMLPDFTALGHVATHAVDLYRVAYQSTIPEQGNRPTTAYGLVAIPQGSTGPLPIVSYQHGTIVDKGEVPSQSFDWLLNPVGSDPELYLASYETRLNVAQFGGQGYAVIAPDYFGVGNSTENDGYISKASQQQACLDMYKASMKLFEAQHVTTSELFLGGWSQGGLVTLDFLEKLESVGIKVNGAATASAPANVQLTSNAWFFNPRKGSEVPPVETPDAPWLNVVGELSNFSITGYAGYPNSPLQMLGVNYEAARAMYMRQFDALEYGATGIIVHRKGLADVTLPYNLQQVFAPQYSGKDNEVAFSQTDYGQLLAAQGAGQTYLSSNMRMYYGTQDEVIPVFAGTAVSDWQKDSFGKKNIEAVPVEAANHRGTFISAVYGELGWFNSLRSPSTG